MEKIKDALTNVLMQILGTSSSLLLGIIADTIIALPAIVILSFLEAELWIKIVLFIAIMYLRGVGELIEAFIIFLTFKRVLAYPLNWIIIVYWISAFCSAWGLLVRIIDIFSKIVGKTTNYNEDQNGNQQLNQNSFTNESACITDNYGNEINPEKVNAILEDYFVYREENLSIEANLAIGKTNPYNGKIITNKNDYLEFLHSRYEEEFQKMRGKPNPLNGNLINNLDDYCDFVDKLRFRKFYEEHIN